MILAIDPGKDKCGLAVLDINGKLIEKRVVVRRVFPDFLREISSKYRPGMIVIGAGAAGRQIYKEIENIVPGKRIEFSTEKDTTRLARQRYWRENPPRGWLKFIPTTLRVPPAPVDDYAALIIGEIFLKSAR